MLPTLRTRTAGYVFVVIVIATATVLTYWNEGTVTKVPRSYYIAAVALSAWCGGIWFGIFTTALSAVVLNFWISHLENSDLFSVSTLPTIFNFLAVSIIISILLEVQRQATVKIKHRHNQIEEALNSINDTFFCLDDKWRFVYANQHACRESPLLREDATGQVIWEVFPKLLGTEIEKRYRYVMEHHAPVRFVSGTPYSTRTYDINVYPTSRGISVLMHDITEDHSNKHSPMKSNFVNHGLVSSLL